MYAVNNSLESRTYIRVTYCIYYILFKLMCRLFPKDKIAGINLGIDMLRFVAATVPLGPEPRTTASNLVPISMLVQIEQCLIKLSNFRHCFQCSILN